MEEGAGPQRNISPAASVSKCATFRGRTGGEGTGGTRERWRGGQNSRCDISPTASVSKCATFWTNGSVGRGSKFQTRRATWLKDGPYTALQSGRKLESVSTVPPQVAFQLFHLTDPHESRAQRTSAVSRYRFNTKQSASATHLPAMKDNAKCRTEVVWYYSSRCVVVATNGQHCTALPRLTCDASKIDLEARFGPVRTDQTDFRCDFVHEDSLTDNESNLVDSRNAISRSGVCVRRVGAVYPVRCVVLCYTRRA